MIGFIPNVSCLFCTIRRITLKRDGWAAYFLCGVKGIEGGLGEGLLANMEIAVSGKVPPGSGLSSSSALVCGSLLTTAHLNDVSIL